VEKRASFRILRPRREAGRVSQQPGPEKEAEEKEETLARSRKPGKNFR